MSEGKNHSEELKKYLEGNMSPAEQHAFERMALDDPFLQEALEGGEQLDSSVFAADVDEINQNINPPQTFKFPVWKVAATVLLVAVSGWFVWSVIDEAPVEEVAQKAESEIIAEPEIIADSTPSETNEPLDVEENSDDELVEFDESANEAKPIAATGTNAVAAKEEVSSEEAKELPEEQADFYAIEDNASGISTSDEEVKPMAQEAVAATEPAKEENYFREEVGEVEAERVANEAEDKAKAVATLRSTEKSDLSQSRAKKASKPATNTRSGQVTDEFGDAVPGVNVVIKGSTTGVTTDLEGNYSISANDDDALIFTSVGMSTQEIQIGSRSTLDVNLSADTQALQEVVVTGYGTYDNEPEGFVGAKPNPDHASFKEYLEENLNYPEEAISKGVEGRVVLQLTISPTGNITNIEVKRGLGSGCDEEAIRLVQEGPTWQPATRDGRNVETTIRVRVKFELE